MGATSQPGTELIRRTNGGEAFALTCPLITKADGGKFGKTESGNVWLDPRYTSPYKFYQFWLNVSDADAEKYIKIFTELTREEIDELVAEQAKDPGQRPLQKRLAKEVTTMVHSAADYRSRCGGIVDSLQQQGGDILRRIDEDTLLAVFEGVPTFEIAKADLDGSVKIVDLLTEKAAVFPSKGELRKLAQQGGFSINKEKVTEINEPATQSLLLNDKYILVQKGKKNYFLLIAK